MILAMTSVTQMFFCLPLFFFFEGTSTFSKSSTVFSTFCFKFSNFFLRLLLWKSCYFFLCFFSYQSLWSSNWFSVFSNDITFRSKWFFSELCFK